jgi:dTDP-4-amino-4,6-dideoxygalactose transaminase
MSPATARAIHPLDLAAERAELGGALLAAVERVLASGQYVLGPEVEALEAEIAALSGVAHGVAVASGTDALVVALRALGVGPGDRVITSPFTFFASAASIALVGATPVLADVDYETALLDPAAAAREVDARTKCILPVHLYGQLADVRALRALADAHGLSLLEDGAQAHGAARDGLACGALGDAGTYSFYPTKNLGAAGEGGMIVTTDGELAARMRRVRDHGSPRKYVHAEIGLNSRMQAIQAAVLRVKLPHLARWNARRQAIAERYARAFAGSRAVRPLRLVPETRHAWHQYTVRVAERDAVQRALAERGIHAGVHYPRPVHLQEAARAWKPEGYRTGDFPAAEALAREVLCLPVHPYLGDADVDRVAQELLAVAG